MKPSDGMLRAAQVLSVRSDFLSAYVSDIIDAVIWEEDPTQVAVRLELLRCWHNNEVNEARGIKAAIKSWFGCW